MKGRQILLDHENLEGAQESSKIATWIAIAAIVLSLLVSIVSICLSIKQMDNPVKFDENQLEKIIPSKVIKSINELKRTQREILRLLMVLQDERKKDETIESTEVPMQE